MDIDKELERIFINYKYSTPIEKLAVDDKSCKKLAEYFDVETGGECSPTRYVQQVLLEIALDKRIDQAEYILSRLNAKRGGAGGRL